jgi:hypothetical protein
MYGKDDPLREGEDVSDSQYSIIDMIAAHLECSRASLSSAVALLARLPEEEALAEIQRLVATWAHECDLDSTAAARALLAAGQAEAYVRHEREKEPRSL